MRNNLDRLFNRFKDKYVETKTQKTKVSYPARSFRRSTFAESLSDWYKRALRGCSVVGKWAAVRWFPLGIMAIWLGFMFWWLGLWALVALAVCSVVLIRN